MSGRDDGGPAFPHSQVEYWGGEKSENKLAGMTLRDWFAGQALQGIIASGYGGGAAHVRDMADGVAGAAIPSAAAYVYADAMLAARKKDQPHE